MNRLEVANLIRVFDFYLAVMAMFSFLRRYTIYRDSLFVLWVMRGRWPRLTDRIRKNYDVLVNWATLRPVVLAVALMLVQLTLSRVVWPDATLRVGDLYSPWWQLIPMILAIIPMVLIDGYFILRVGTFDRNETLKYLDMAEGWAGTWKARAVRLATLGKINPDQMVNEQLRQGLLTLGQTVNWSMWWVSAQVGARLFCGLVIWCLWAIR